MFIVTLVLLAGTFCVMLEKDSGLIGLMLVVYVPVCDSVQCIELMTVTLKRTDDVSNNIIVNKTKSFHIVDKR